MAKSTQALKFGRGAWSDPIVNQVDRISLVNYVDTMSSLERQVANPDPEIGLRAVAALRRLADELEPLHVQRAREAGWAWQRIAVLLQVSKQAVHKKYSEREN